MPGSSGLVAVGRAVATEPEGTVSVGHNHVLVPATERAHWLPLGLTGSFPVFNGAEAALIRTDDAALVIAWAAITAGGDRRMSKGKF